MAPSIIFFDEIDALATKRLGFRIEFVILSDCHIVVAVNICRGVSSAGVNDRVLAQLLTELDGPQVYFNSEYVDHSLMLRYVIELWNA